MISQLRWACYGEIVYMHITIYGIFMYYSLIVLHIGTLSNPAHVCVCVLIQVNIIPVIAKADTISRSELSQFKARVSDML